ncbi:hypothetical protein IGI04_007775, partial [Brassica rapa subsp. trilocularis]
HEFYLGILRQPVPVNEFGPDIVLWKHAQDDYQSCFSASRTWKQIRDRREKVAWSNVVWFSQAVPRYSFIPIPASTDKSVLIAFNDKMIMLPGPLVYRVDEDIHNVTDSAIRDIMSFTCTIIISMNSVLPYNGGGLVRLKKTDVVPRLKASGVRVFVETFSNEFVTQPLDLFSDSTVEIDFLVQRAKIDGIITDFPATTARYKSKTKSPSSSHSCFFKVFLRQSAIIFDCKSNASFTSSSSISITN